MVELHFTHVAVSEGWDLETDRRSGIVQAIRGKRMQDDETTNFVETGMHP